MKFLKRQDRKDRVQEENKKEKKKTQKQKYTSIKSQCLHCTINVIIYINKRVCVCFGS